MHLHAVSQGQIPTSRRRHGRARLQGRERARARRLVSRLLRGPGLIRRALLALLLRIRHRRLCDLLHAHHAPRHSSDLMHAPDDDASSYQALKAAGPMKPSFIRSTLA